MIKIGKQINVLEKKHGEYIHDLETENDFLNMSQNVLAINETVTKVYYIKVRITIQQK